jgi:hypothetical protein
MKSRWRLPVKFWAASRKVANDCITEHLLAFLWSKEERQSSMVALPLLYPAWDFIFSQVPNCVNALYSTSPGTLTGLLEQAPAHTPRSRRHKRASKAFWFNSVIARRNRSRWACTFHVEPSLTLSRSSYSLLFPNTSINWSDWFDKKEHLLLW